MRSTHRKSNPSKLSSVLEQFDRITTKSYDTSQMNVKIT